MLKGLGLGLEGPGLGLGLEILALTTSLASARFPNTVSTYNLYQCVVLSMYCLNNIGSPVNDDRVTEKNYNLLP